MARQSDRPLKPPGAVTKPPGTIITPAKSGPGPRRHSFNAIKYASQRPTGPVQEQEKSRCVVCGGNVVESHANLESATGRHSMTRSGFHCENCGILYAFMPPAKWKKK